MKKPFILSSIVSITSLLLLSLFSSCHENVDGETEFVDSVRIDDAANCYDATTSGQTFNGLNAMLVYYLAKNYKEQQLNAINNHMPGVGQGDARSVWYDLETLKKFIYEIESQTCAKCDNDGSKRLGIRIYYGAYPDSTKWDDAELWGPALTGVPKKYAGKHTVMMVPTYHDDANNIEVDFDPTFITDGCNFSDIELLYQKMKTNPPTGITLTILSGMATTAQNHGGLIPPPFIAGEIVDEGAGIMYAVDTN